MHLVENRAAALALPQLSSHPRHTSPGHGISQPGPPRSASFQCLKRLALTLETPLQPAVRLDLEGGTSIPLEVQCVGRTPLLMLIS